MKKLLSFVVCIFVTGCSVIAPDSTLVMTPAPIMTSTSTPVQTPTPLTSTMTPTPIMTPTPTPTPTLMTILEEVPFPSCNREDYTRICPGQLIITEKSSLPGIPAEYTITGYVAEDPKPVQASDNKILIAFPYSEHSHAYFYFNLGNAEDLWLLFYVPRRGIGGTKGELVTTKEFLSLPFLKKGAIISLQLFTGFYNVEELEPQLREEYEKKDSFARLDLDRSDRFAKQNADLLALLKEQRTGMLEVEVGGSSVITIKSD